MKSGKEKPVVLVVNEYYERGKEVYDSIEDLYVETAPVDEASLSEMIKEKQPFAVVIGAEKYSGPLYEAMKRGGLIARFGVGYDGVNLDKAKKAGLIVTNTPGVLEDSVAEHTIFLAGEVLRKPGLMSKQIKQGGWNLIPGTELKGKTWAVLGLGNIGRKVSSILSFGFGAKVYALKRDTSNHDELKEKYGVEKLSFDYSEIVSDADIISLHLPANEETYHFMNKTRLQQLKPGAVLINTGRGSLIDEEAMYDALANNHLSGAGLDVFENEPYEPVNEAKDLRKLPNVVLTPHVGSNTDACSKRITERVIQNIQLARDEKYEKMDIVSA